MLYFKPCITPAMIQPHRRPNIFVLSYAQGSMGFRTFDCIFVLLDLVILTVFQDSGLLVTSKESTLSGFGNWNIQKKRWWKPIRFPKAKYWKLRGYGMRILGYKISTLPLFNRILLSDLPQRENLLCALLSGD